MPALVATSGGRLQPGDLFIHRWLGLILSIILAAFAVPSSAADLFQATWSKRNVEALLRAVEASRDEGLDPEDYDRKDLQRALNGGGDSNRMATSVALRLAGDYANGRIRNRRSSGWYMDGLGPDEFALWMQLGDVLRDERLEEWLQNLLPQHPQYQALRAALADTTKLLPEQLDRIRVNLERWRWMPRELGIRYVFVNVPSYRLDLIDNGLIAASHDVVVGRARTPTPQIAAEVTGVVFNPWWLVPPSIVAEQRLRRTKAAIRAGYVFGSSGDGAPFVRQRPGPRNALGRMKIDMPNPHAIYLHDTPIKSLFDKPSRAFSHGCIRVKDAIGFAAALLQSELAWNQTAIAATLRHRKPVTADLNVSFPIYIAYFTVSAQGNGTLLWYDDPYKRDDWVLNALGPMQKRPRGTQIAAEADHCAGRAACTVPVEAPQSR